jgi:hypothetical protein
VIGKLICAKSLEKRGEIGIRDGDSHAVAQAGNSVHRDASLSHAVLFPQHPRMAAD